MPPAPRRPVAPPAPPRIPIVRILPGRGERSESLDALHEVEFVPWDKFVTEYPLRLFPLSEAQHITFLGRQGSGKTTLAVKGVLPQFKYAVVLATKAEDSSLYGPLLKQGYKISDDPAIDFRKTPKVIFKPALASPTREAIAGQREAFRAVLAVIFNERNWAVYADEIRYLSDNLGLSTELETLWLQGRSLKVTMLAATQNPVGIPREAFDQANHLFIWRQTEKQRVDRIAEMIGSESDLIRALVPSLPPHEALYVRASDDAMVRTRYPRA
jgi:hypothetical protein